MGGPVPLGARATVVCVEEPFIDIVLDSKIVSGNKLVCVSVSVSVSVSLCLCLSLSLSLYIYIYIM